MSIANHLISLIAVIGFIFIFTIAYILTISLPILFYVAAFHFALIISIAGYRGLKTFLEKL